MPSFIIYVRIHKCKPVDRSLAMAHEDSLGAYAQLVHVGV
jgi:hypothetical protein